MADGFQSLIRHLRVYIYISIYGLCRVLNRALRTLPLPWERFSPLKQERRNPQSRVPDSRPPVGWRPVTSRDLAALFKRRRESLALFLQVCRGERSCPASFSTARWYELKLIAFPALTGKVREITHRSG